MEPQSIRRLTLAALLVTLLGLAPPAAAAAPAATKPAKVALVALNDNGQSGPPVGCGDSLVPVTVDVPTASTTAGKITQALLKLFSIKQQFYGQSGLYTALYMNNLVVDRVEMQGSVAAIYLSGALSLGGECDDPRAEGQVAQTARLVPGVTGAVVIYKGGPLTNLVGSRAFPETNHAVAPPFFPYWEVHGGLPAFGYSLTDQFVEGGLRVQYFERQRFEGHPENLPPYHVLFGLLGGEDAQRRGLMGTPPFARQAAVANPACEYVPQTGHNLCYGFRAYWHAHGLDFGEPGITVRESLALFGYPLSEEFRMTLADGQVYTVQYFERARLEWHPENAPPYDILLGRLGADVLATR
jgi:hypothetical protein